MKLPEYSLKYSIEYHPEGHQGDAIAFPAGTLLQPFWSPHNLPQHIRDQLNAAPKTMQGGPYRIMCLIGRFWIIVMSDNIRESRW